MSRSYASSPRYQQYSSRFDRGKTFWAWQHIKPSYQECVNAGFFFQGPGDIVRCFSCGIGFKDFCEFDNLMEEHIRHSPTCAFLESLYGVPGLQQRHRQILSKDENMRAIHNQYMECTRNQVNNKPYRHPELSENDRRLATFQNPNFQSVLTPKRLADAGLYYTGEGDHVRCFACGGGLRRWEVNDDPWTEHCRWFRSCRFAREVKGTLSLRTF